MHPQDLTPKCCVCYSRLSFAVSVVRNTTRLSSTRLHLSYLRGRRTAAMTTFRVNPGSCYCLRTRGFLWSNEDLPPEWLQANGRVVQNYRNHVPRLLHVQPDGAVFEQPSRKTVQGFYQPSPFLICQGCGEYYTLRDRDFRKLTGLSNEGRSSATTTLSITSLDHAGKANITGSARKLLSFTDNRQDASLQAGHFNDFVLVGLLRSAIYNALDQHGELRHYNIAEKAKEALGLRLQDIAHNPALDPSTPAAANTWRAFQDLIQYRIYEDLRRAWRVVHPNLEQCGLLRIEYEGLEIACQRGEVWSGLLPITWPAP